jgi:hypothetical protein
MIADNELKRQVETRRAQMNTAQNLDSFVRAGVEPATAALNALAKSANALTSKLPGGVPAGGAATTTAPAGGGGGASAAMLMGVYGAASGRSFGAGNLAGLPIKSGEATAGGETPAQLAALAQTIYSKLGTNIKYFSAFNDLSHDKSSAHTAGRALDFVLNDPSTYASVAAMVRGLPGVKSVRDEANYPIPGVTTGPHIHAEISGRNGWGGTLSGPSSGYRPNITMHGTEDLTIKPKNTSSSSDPAIIKMDEQVYKMEEMISLLKTSNSLQTKLIQMQS